MKVADDPSPELQLKWFEMMKLVLQEVDEAQRCVPADFHFYFLDLGCVFSKIFFYTCIPTW
jgi:hypothetical protein